MDIQQNYFELFKLPLQYALDDKKLLTGYRELQRQFHPDRYAGALESEQRLALQYSSFINEAYQCLNSPVARADYLLQLNGVEKNDAQTLSSAPEFLMQQIEWRERLSEIEGQVDPEAELEKISEELDREMGSLQEQFSACYGAGDNEKALILVNKMHFLHKLAEEVETLENELFE